MVNQGLYGALSQYWSVDEKPRLNRRNSFFDEEIIVSEKDALRLGIVVSVLATAIIIFWSIGGGVI